MKEYTLGFIFTPALDHVLLVHKISPEWQAGKAASEILDHIGITVNKNSVPNDPQSPLVTSGVRIGTPACTTRGLKEKDFEIVADVIGQALCNPADEGIHKKLRATTAEVCERFPLYRGLISELYP